MPALTPEQEALKQAALAANKLGMSGTAIEAEFRDHAHSGAILAILARLEECNEDYGQAVDSVAQLQDEVDQWRAKYEAALQQPAQAVPDAVLQIITKHAYRYLWLRQEFATSAIPRVWQSNDSAEPVKCLLGEELDAAIDAEVGRAVPGEPGQ